MDEYERAAVDLRNLVEAIPEAQFMEILDGETTDEDCRSVQTIMAHVVRAGYSYADYLREVFANGSNRPALSLSSKRESLEKFDAMLEYTVETLQDRWVISDDEIDNSPKIKSRWGVTYDIEQMLEHAIVHILRHRRQIERLLARAG